MTASAANTSTCRDSTIAMAGSAITFADSARQFWFTGAHPGPSWAKTIPGFGADFKKSVKERFPALISMHPYGEVLPRPDNRVTVEGTPLDQYGMPQFRIIFSHSENERKMAADMYDTAEAIMKAGKSRDRAVRAREDSTSWAARFMSTVHAAWARIRRSRR